MTISKFGVGVSREAAELIAGGKDANQTANILFQRDPKGRNYGIGIILDGRGKPAKTSAALLKAAKRELASDSGVGNYMNSAKSADALKESLFEWQGIPKKLLGRFKLVTPSDAGTGAVQTGMQSAQLLDPKLKTIAIERLSWPAYKTIAKVLGLRVEEFQLGGAASRRGVLPVYQAGPHNSTGRAPRADEVKARARAAAKAGGWVLLDRAYSGFEFASKLGALSYRALMKRSYETQLKPFVDAGVPFLTAISPTKAFGTFALRPCGLLLAYCPDAKSEKAVAGAFTAAIRARGSAFEHPVTRAFIRAMISDRAGLERAHVAALKRLQQAERAWKKHIAGTPLENAFSEDYAGLFRNVEIKPGADAALYGEHLYPVFTPGRCRLNVTGLPADAKRAAKDAALFAGACR
jgi:aspartate/tyrosine/aromatic aminotransferase